MGAPDRIIRLIIAISLLGLYLSGIVSGGIGVTALTLAGILLLTSGIGFCSLYRLLGISTVCEKK